MLLTLLEVSIPNEVVSRKRKRIVYLSSQALKDSQISIEIKDLSSPFMLVVVRVCYFVVWW